MDGSVLLAGSIRQVAQMCTPYKAKNWMPWQRHLGAGYGNICLLLADHSNFPP